jgi:hypothetical protein
MKIGKWTIVVDDKRIIKQYGDGIGIGYEILDNNFWSNLNSNIFAIQYTGDVNDSDQVEYRDETKHSIFSGDIKIFSDKWDEQYLLNLQNIWDNNYIYEEIPHPKSTLENPRPNILVIKQETIEQKTTRLGPRPSIYISENIY